MKLLMAFTVLQRARHSPSWLAIPPIQTVVLVTASASRHSILFGSTFHAGAARALLARAGVEVVVLRAGAPLTRRRRGERLPVPSAQCYAAGATLKSHANRFAFPDALLDVGYDGESPRPAPLASDGLALRDSVFGRGKAPAMRRKLLYVARRVGKRRSFTKRGEVVMRKMLGEVAEATGFQLSVFEGMGMKTPFFKQVAFFADASVVVGFHGAGLALCALAPRGAVLVEIEPEDHAEYLFGNLISSGLEHFLFNLSSGTRKAHRLASELEEGDLERLRAILLGKLRKM